MAVASEVSGARCAWHRMRTRAAKAGERILEDGTKLVWEFDGKDKYTRFAGEHGDTVARMMHERQRESRLTAVCDAVIRFDYRTVMTPGALARLLDAYGVPRVASRGI